MAETVSLETSAQWATISHNYDEVFYDGDRGRQYGIRLSIEANQESKVVEEV